MSDLTDRDAGDGRSPVRRALLAGLALVAVLAAVCGWLGYQFSQDRQAAALRGLLLGVAKQSAVNLTSIDYRRADADVQRILESSTGQFYEDFKARSAPFVDVVKRVQSTSTGTVTEAGVVSIDGAEGRFLVAVSVSTSTRGVPDDQLRYWRMRLTVVKDGADAKVSKVEFVP